jgi:hypothetical protein
MNAALEPVASTLATAGVPRSFRIGEEPPSVRINEWCFYAFAGVSAETPAKAGMSDLSSRIEYMVDTNVLEEAIHNPGFNWSPADDLKAVPVEHLEARICELAGHLTAATCQFLLLIADFDARRGWASWEMPSCAAWLSWKCQIAPGTAREHVRVARLLSTFPLIREEFAAGGCRMPRSVP